ncbi:MAG: crossover junction endodeoxyribonuclease RuvC [Proteobacteria bacterium]|nr:crossover junction endodeoxyribonuclease RuvC [Pseudomonadota bacterium]MCH9758339.1 crossover junction endodeoxyribonuclease RuvC [Pseudomonadota bacterium]
MAKTGWGVVETSGKQSRYVDSGLFTTSASTLHIERLRLLADELKRVLQASKPDLIAIERVFINSNLKSSLLLGEARGAAIVTLLQGNVPVIEISALQIKQSLTGMGRAGKTQVANMVGSVLSISVSDLAHDCTDALACALAANSHHATQIPLRRNAPRRRTLRSLGRLVK